MTLKSLTFGLCIILMSACTNDVSQFAIEGNPLEAGRRSNTTIEVLEVSLPLYMQGQDIPVMDETGAIKTSDGAVWADDPARSISLNLAESLSRLSGGIASVEPWPLDEPALKRLDVRVKTLLANNLGILEFRGQYFLTPDDGSKPKVDWFNIAVPMRALDARSIAHATGIATQQLAREILGR